MKTDGIDEYRQRIVFCQNFNDTSLEYKKSTPEELSACSDNSSDKARARKQDRKQDENRIAKKYVNT